MIGLGLSIVQIAVRQFLGFSPRSLFAGGAQGVWYDPSDYTTLFQDSAGTTPVTAVEQPVGLMLDKSQGLVVGPVLFSTSTFTEGWSLSAAASIVNGTLVLTSAGNAAGAFLLNPPGMGAGFGINEYLEVTFEIISISSGAVSVSYGYSPGTSNPKSSPGVYTVRGYALDTYIRVYGVGASTTAVIDNISVRKIAGNHAFQSTSASRPVLSARYNLLTKTEQFDDAVWVKTGLQPFGSGSIVNATTAPDGTLTADFICENSSAGFHRLDSGVGVSYIAGTSLTSTIRVKSTTRNYSPYLGNASGAITATFNLSNGTVSVAASNIGTASGATASITQDAQGFWLCTLSGVVSTSSSTNAIFYHQIVSGTNASYTGDGTSGIFIWGASLVPANQSSIPYQRVNTATDYATTGFLPYLRFDGVDDSLSTNSISFTATDKMSVFAGMRKLSDAATVILVELSINAGPNDGTFFVAAPVSASANYQFTSKGTVLQSAAYTNAAVAAPVTNVVTGLGNISGDLATLRVNGAQLAQSTADQGTGNYGNYPLFIGRRGNSSLPFNGQLYSMVIVGKAVTAGELTSTETYVNQKTGAY